MNDASDADMTPEARQEAINGMTASDHLDAARYQLASVAALGSAEGRAHLGAEDPANPEVNAFVVQSVLSIAQTHALIGIGMLLSPTGEDGPAQGPVLDSTV